MSRAADLLAVDAAIEGATGLALIAAPGLLARFLFAASLDDGGTIMARLAGMALVSLAVACWMGRRSYALRAGVAGMLAFNILAGAYLALLGLGETPMGPLLWPVAVVHVAMAFLFAVLWPGLRPALERET
jgi:hypothetical protein